MDLRIKALLESLSNNNGEAIDCYDPQLGIMMCSFCCRYGEPANEEHDKECIVTDAKILLAEAALGRL